MRTLLVAVALIVPAQDDPQDTGFATTKEAMQNVQLIVGEWKCFAEPEDPKREAWTEKADWNFKIQKDVYTLVLTASDGRLYKNGELSYDIKAKRYLLTLTRPDDSSARYRGTVRNRELTLEEIPTADPKAVEQERIVFHLLRANRYLMTVDRRKVGARSWDRAFTFGCTKKGVPFVRGEAPKCVITGGAGTIAVEYQDKTYYVC